MLLRYALAPILFAIAASSAAQIKVSQVVTAAESVGMLSSEVFDKYITRGSFCSLVLDELVFSEALPGTFIMDMTVKLNSPARQEKVLNVLFDDLIEVKSPGEPIRLKVSKQFLARQIPLAEISDVELIFRLTPISNDRYQPVYRLLAPLLSRPMYGIEIGSVFEAFTNVAAADTRSRPLFKATLPVPQDVLEAQRIASQPASNAPLMNNQIYAIQMEGAREVRDPSVVGKVQEFINGITTVVAGRNVIPKQLVSFKSAIAMRFTKDLTQPLPEEIIGQLKDLSNGAEYANSSDSLTQVSTKAADSIKSIDAVWKARQVDGRTDFHLRNYIELSRLWAHYKQVNNSTGDAALRSDTRWRNQFYDWYDRLDRRGAAYSTQAYGISDTYPGGRLAKIFLPYGLGDEMTLELVQRQVTLHQALARIGDFSKASPRPQ